MTQKFNISFNNLKANEKNVHACQKKESSHIYSAVSIFEKVIYSYQCIELVNIVKVKILVEARESGIIAGYNRFLLQFYALLL